MPWAVHMLSEWESNIPRAGPREVSDNYTDANTESKHKADVVEWEKEDTDGQNTPKQLNDL